MKTHLPLLTHSSITSYRRCPQEYFLRYVLLRKPRIEAKALQFGSLFHRGLNAWWRAANLPASARLYVAVDAMAREECEDPYEQAKAVALIVGYTARWGDERYETLVEKQFRYPLEFGRPGHGDTGEVGMTVPGDVYDLGGAIDVIAMYPSDVRPQMDSFTVEHKTTSKDIAPGSEYWRNIIALDPQVNMYWNGATNLGYPPSHCLYDAIRKPTLEPMLATPEESRKYTKPTKNEPTPRLYANQRETDETPEEYQGRIIADIAANPDKYFQRQEVVRLAADQERHNADVIMTARMIQSSEDYGLWPRHPNACERFGRYCEYHPVCSGEAKITDEGRYETKETQHEELANV